MICSICKCEIGPGQPRQGWAGDVHHSILWDCVQALRDKVDAYRELAGVAEEYLEFEKGLHHGGLPTKLIVLDDALNKAKKEEK